MKAGYFSETSNISKLMFSLFIIIVSFIVFALLGFVLSMLIFKIDLTHASVAFSNVTNPANIPMLKFFQVVQSIGLFLLPPFIIGFLFSKSSLSYLRVNVSINIITVVAAILIMISAIPFINFMGELNSMLSLPHFMHGVEAWMKDSEQTAQKITQAFLNVNTTGGLLLNIFIVAVVPAVSEELLFRGVFQKIFSDWTKNIHIGILISAILFSGFHMQFYGFFPRMVLGLFFGYLLAWSGSIWLPVIAHFVNNAVAVIISYFINMKMIGSDVETIGTTEANGFVFVVLSILTVTGFIAGIYLNERKRNKNILI